MLKSFVPDGISDWQFFSAAIDESGPLSKSLIAVESGESSFGIERFTILRTTEPSESISTKQSCNSVIGTSVVTASVFLVSFSADDGVCGSFSVAGFVVCSETLLVSCFSGFDSSCTG